MVVEDFADDLIPDAEVLVRLGFPWIPARDLVKEARRLMDHHEWHPQMPKIKSSLNFEDFLRFAGVGDDDVNVRCLIKRHRYSKISDFTRDEHLVGPEVLVRQGFPWVTSTWLIQLAENCVKRFH